MNGITLSSRHAKFVDEYLIDGNGTQAAIRAGYGAAGARVAAHRLLTNVAISSLIETRRQADAAQLSIDRENVLQGLLEAVDMARADRNPAGLIAAWREIAKLQGYYAPLVARVEVDAGVADWRGRFEAMTDGELVRVIEQYGTQAITGVA